MSPDVSATQALHELLLKGRSATGRRTTNMSDRSVNADGLKRTAVRELGDFVIINEDIIEVRGERIERNGGWASRAEAGAALARYQELTFELGEAATMRDAALVAIKHLPTAAALCGWRD